jgi:hypothetical protein
MNVPRLNIKRDVMTLSGTGGKLNIFQRIEMAKSGMNIRGHFYTVMKMVATATDLILWVSRRGRRRKDFNLPLHSLVDSGAVQGGQVPKKPQFKDGD